MMSGGALYNYTYPNFEEADGKWQDEELNELYSDLFCGGEFAVHGYGGLAQSLDYYLSGDIDRSDYLDYLQEFKRKWFKRTPKNRTEYYQRKLQEYADKLKDELVI